MVTDTYLVLMYMYGPQNVNYDIYLPYCHDTLVLDPDMYVCYICFGQIFFYKCVWFLLHVKLSTIRIYKTVMKPIWIDIHQRRQDWGVLSVIQCFLAVLYIMRETQYILYIKHKTSPHILIKVYAFPLVM